MFVRPGAFPVFPLEFYMSKLITLNDAETTATVAEAKIGDIFSSMIDSKKSVTGMYKFVQLGVAAAAGAAIQNVRLRGGVQFWQPV